MKYTWTKKYDKVSYGLIAGLIFPIIGFFVAYLIKGADSSLGTFWFIFIKDSDGANQFVSEQYTNTRREILTLCLICNMLVFYLPFFIWKMDRFSKGIVGSTLLLAALAFIFIF